MMFITFIDEVVGRKLQVFSDVMDEFSRVPSILMHFREWKYSFPTSYNQAYISLYVPKVIAPYIRLQLISWNPLNPHEYILVEDLPWMQDLLFFDHQKGCEDNDLYFIPKLIELTVIPKLNGKYHVIDKISAVISESFLMIRSFGECLGSIIFHANRLLEKMYSVPHGRLSIRSSCVSKFVPSFGKKDQADTRK